MGTYSFFEASVGDCDVDWDAMDTAKVFKFRYFKHIYEDKRATARTCAAVGALLQECKLFGYFTPDLISALNEFNRHLVPNGQSPMWIFSCEGADTTRAVRFHPGKRVELIGGQWMSGEGDAYFEP